MKKLFEDIRLYISDSRKEGFVFYCVILYLIFSYLRPQAIYPWLNVIPWTRLVLIIGIIYLFSEGRIRIQLPHVALFIFALVVTISAYTAVYPEISTEKIGTIYIWLIEVIFFTSAMKSLKQYYLMTIAFFIILFKMSAFGARVWVIDRGFGFRGWGIAGPDGFFANSGEFSLLMAMLAIMSVTFLYAVNSKRKIYYILPLTAVMTVIGASSRGGQLALLVGILMFSILIMKLRIKNIVIFALLLTVLLNLLPDEQKERFSSMGDDNTSVSRMLYWEKGFEIISRYNLLGIGIYGFPSYFQDHYASEIDSDAYTFQHKEVEHNSYIEVGVATGYIGFVCYLWLIFICYRLNKKTQKLINSMPNDMADIKWSGAYSIGLNISLLTYLIGSTFMSVAFYPYLYLMLMLSQSLYNSVSDIRKDVIKLS